MTSALYLEHYLDGLESLPTELKRNFTLMRELDTRAETLMKQIDEKVQKVLEILKIFKFKFLGNWAHKKRRKFKRKHFRRRKKGKNETHPGTFF